MEFVFDIKVKNCKRIPPNYHKDTIAKVATDIDKDKSTVHSIIYLKKTRTPKKKFEDIVHESGHIVLDAIQTVIQKKLQKELDESLAVLFEKVTIEALKEANLQPKF